MFHVLESLHSKPNFCPRNQNEQIVTDATSDNVDFSICEFLFEITYVFNINNWPSKRQLQQ